MSDLVVHGGSGKAPATRPATTPLPAHPSGHGAVIPADLSAFSVLDSIGGVMTGLNAYLEHLLELVQLLDQTARALDAQIVNVDARSQLYEAPLATRTATDEAAVVGDYIANLVLAVRAQTAELQEVNLQAALALRTVLAVQEEQRAIGAGGRLLASAGH